MVFVKEIKDLCGLLKQEELRWRMRRELEWGKVFKIYFRLQYYLVKRLIFGFFQVVIYKLKQRRSYVNWNGERKLKIRFKFLIYFLGISKRDNLVWRCNLGLVRYLYLE